MLTNKKLSITGLSMVSDAKLIEFVAVMDLETGKMGMAERRGDSELLEENFETAHADRQAFERFAYSVKNDVKGLLGLGNTETASEEPAEEETA